MHEIYRQLPFLCLQVSLVHAALPQPLIQRWPCLLCALQSVLMTKMRYICYETSKKDLTNSVISGNDLYYGGICFRCIWSYYFRSIWFVIAIYHLLLEEQVLLIRFMYISTYIKKFLSYTPMFTSLFTFVIFRGHHFTDR